MQNSNSTYDIHSAFFFVVHLCMCAHVMYAYVCLITYLVLINWVKSIGQVHFNTKGVILINVHSIQNCCIPVVFRAMLQEFFFLELVSSACPPIFVQSIPQKALSHVRVSLQFLMTIEYVHFYKKKIYCNV